MDAMQNRTFLWSGAAAAAAMSCPVTLAACSRWSSTSSSLLDVSEIRGRHTLLKLIAWLGTAVGRQCVCLLFRPAGTHEQLPARQRS
jgi:hypothetical protein